MKRVFLLMLCVSFLHASQDLYHEYVQQWLNTYIIDQNSTLSIPKGDLKAIKRLIELSLRRSEQTRIAQEQALQAVGLIYGRVGKT